MAESARSNPVLYIAGPLLCRYCLALGNVIDQLDAQQSVTQDDEAIKKGSVSTQIGSRYDGKYPRTTRLSARDIEARRNCVCRNLSIGRARKIIESRTKFFAKSSKSFNQSSAEMSELFEGCATTRFKIWTLTSLPTIHPSSILAPCRRRALVKLPSSIEAEEARASAAAGLTQRRCALIVVW